MTSKASSMFPVFTESLFRIIFANSSTSSFQEESFLKMNFFSAFKFFLDFANRGIKLNDSRP